MRILIHIVLCVILLLSCSQVEVVQEDLPSYVIELNRTTSSAGQSISGVIHPCESHRKPLLQLSSIYTTRSIEYDPECVFVIDSSFLLLSGNYELLLSLNGEVLFTTAIHIQPGSPASIFSHYGPKTITINGDDHSEFLFTKLDQFGNFIQDSSSFKINEWRKTLIENSIVQSGHFALYNMFPGRLKDKVIVTASVDQLSSSQFEVRVETNDPKPFTLSTINSFPFADNREFIEVQTSLIKDREGNSVVDGSLVTFSINTSDGQKIVSRAPTIGGVARVFFRNPDRAQNWKISAVLGQVKSLNDVSFSFQSSVTPFSIKLDSSEVIIGPVTGLLGQLVNDGFPLQLNIVHASLGNIQKNLFIESGYVHYKVPFYLYNDGLVALEVIAGGVKVHQAINL